MSRKKNHKVPAQLARVQQRFAVWRRTRRARTRIPEPLWAAAVKLAASFGIHQTASALKLDYYSLKKRLEQMPCESLSARASGQRPAFVELQAPLAPAAECVIELEDAQGASMRVHLKGVDVPDVVALSHSFWNPQ